MASAVERQLYRYVYVQSGQNAFIQSRATDPLPLPRSVTARSPVRQRQARLRYGGVRVAPSVVNAIRAIYIDGMETYLVRNTLRFTAERWEKVSAFRSGQKISTEAEAVGPLIHAGPKAGSSGKTTARK
jgi:hypothetical protein